MNFKEFIIKEEGDFNNLEIASMYYNGNGSVRALASKTGRSVAEIYRIIHSYGKPNRMKNQHGTVLNLASSGMHPRTISQFTGYTPRHVNNIIKNNSNDSNNI